MTRLLSHRQARLLLAPYALDALPAVERDAVERHLAACRTCAAEVDANHEALGRLAGEGEAPPDHLWDKIAASLPPAPAADRRPRAVPPFAGRRRREPAFIVAAAAVVLLFSLVGVRSVQLQQRLDDIRHSPYRGVTEAAKAARGAPGARVLSLRHKDGQPLAEAVILPDGSGYLDSSALSPLADGQGYQLWAMVGDTPISVALLGPRPATSAFRVPPGAAALAVSVEGQWGSVAPTGQPVALGPLPNLR